MLLPRSLRGRFHLLFVIAVIAGIAAVITGLTELEGLSGDATLVNLSGSLRMRAYLISSLAGSYAAIPSPDIRERLESELDQYAALLSALARGSYPAPKPVRAPPARLRLTALADSFPAYRAGVEALVRASD